MDQSRIDELTRFFARRAGRRTVAAGALGGLLVTLLPGVSATDAAAKRKPKPSTCKKPKRRCGKTCVNVNTSRQHCGKCNRKCRPGYACRQGTCTPPCGKGGNCRVFVTSTVHPGNLGGLAGADAICKQLAKDAKLPGTYKAWLSLLAGSPVNRFTHNPGPYVLTNGVRIALNWTDLTDGNLFAPINIMENGRPVPGDELVWTGTMASGTASRSQTFCRDWRTSSRDAIGAFGHSSAQDVLWSAREDISVAENCGETLRLYCFQQS